ncbi:MAG: hypothetical protein WCL29_06970, partial [Pseudomonadota bacterium]
MPILTNTPMKTGWVTMAVVTVVLAACSEQKTQKVEAAAMSSIAQQNREIAERMQTQNSANEEKAFQERLAAERKRLVKLVQEPI